MKLFLLSPTGYDICNGLKFVKLFLSFRNFSGINFINNG